MKRLTAMFISLVLVFTTVATTMAAPPNPGSGGTNFTVQNLDSAADAAVHADYVNQSGGVDAFKDKTIASLASDGFPITDSGLSDNWIGSVVVSADKKIVAFAQMIWQNGDPGDGSTSDGKTAGAYNGFEAGSPKLYLPSLASRDAQFSRVSVQSAAAPSTTAPAIGFSIKFYDRSGNLSHTINDTVYQGAQKTYSLSPADMSELGGNWLGSAIIEATDSTSPLAAVSTMHWRQYAAGYSAVPGGGTTVYLPSANRRINAGGAWLQYTSVVVQNLSTTQAANATVTWYDREGNVLHTFVDPIPANSSHGYNTRYPVESDIPEASKTTLPTDLGTNWNGSVVISSDGPDVVAVANLQWTNDHPAKAAASAFTSPVAGTPVVYLPATFRRVNAGTWIQYTGAIVQNVGTASCTFDVTWTPRAGATGTPLTYQDTLAPNIAHGYNTGVASDIPSTVDIATSLGDGFLGAVTMDAPGCELVAIHNTVWPAWTDNTTYNGFGGQ